MRRGVCRATLRQLKGLAGWCFRVVCRTALQWMCGVPSGSQPNPPASGSLRPVDVLKASAGAASLSLLAEAVTDPSPSLEAAPLPTPTGTVKWLPWRGPMYLGSVSPSTFTWNPSMTGAIWLGTLNSKRWREPLPFPAEGRAATRIRASCTLLWLGSCWQAGRGHAAVSRSGYGQTPAAGACIALHWQARHGCATGSQHSLQAHPLPPAAWTALRGCCVGRTVSLEGSASQDGTTSLLRPCRHPCRHTASLLTGKQERRRGTR